LATRVRLPRVAYGSGSNNRPPLGLVGTRVRELRVGRPVEPFELTAEEKQTLERWARGRTVSQALARRARIVLECAAGRLCTEVAREEKTSIQTVSKWRQRFVDRRLDGMADTPHPNVHRKWPMIGSKS
jgi:hypothetical protein